MSAARQHILTIAAIVAVGASIVIGTVAVPGVAAASPGDVSIDEDFDGSNPGNLQTLQGGVPEQTDEVGGLPTTFRVGFSGSTETETRFRAIDQLVVNSQTETTPTSTGGTPTLSTTLITDANTGDGNEVTLTVNFDEGMTNNTDAVRIRPDLDGVLETTPTVETKRWLDSRTLEATIRFADDNETVSGVRLAVDGATDLAGNELNRSLTTYDIETTNPRVQSTAVTAPDTVTVTFSEGVYSNDNSTGNLTRADFDYSDENDAGGSGIVSVSHSGGDSNANLTLDSAIHNSDFESDTITIPGSAIDDAFGNPVSAGSYTYTDGAFDDVQPRITSFRASESRSEITISFTVDEQLSSANLAIDSNSMYFYEDLQETLNGDGSYTYSVTHNPTDPTGSTDGQYTVGLTSMSDGTNVVTSFGPMVTSQVVVDTRGPRFGSLLLPSNPINTATPTLKIDGVSDRLSTVDEETISINISATDGSSVASFSGETSNGLNYANNRITLNLSATGTRLRSETTYDVSVSANDNDVPANTNSTVFPSALTVGNTLPTVGTLSLSTNPITEAQTGEGNEVTLTARFNKDMNVDTSEVRVTPDLNGELQTQPTVENKRWNNSRTFKADIQFTDDNENISDINLGVGGAKDLDGNMMERASTTYAVETIVADPIEEDEEIKDVVWLFGVLLAYYLILEASKDY